MGANVQTTQKSHEEQKKSASIDSAYQHNSHELMKYNRADRDTSRIFAIEALDTFLANIVWISSWPYIKTSALGSTRYFLDRKIFKVPVIDRVAFTMPRRTT